MVNDTITAVEGVKVGHAQRSGARTGCSVVLLSPPSEVACEARGGWPGTYDTDSIGVGKKFLSKHAIFLTGGDVFGFDTAIGIRRYLLEQGEAHMKGAGNLPGIVGANIYDLEFADIKGARYERLGYEACRSASSAPVKEGNVGAGTGGTVGKLNGLGFACKGGCGSAARKLTNGLTVGAMVITNALGNIVDPETGVTVAGVRDGKGGFLNFDDFVEEYLRLQPKRSNTTIGVVATNAELSHEQLIKVAQVAHDGLALAIRPVHTLRDGDTIFATSTRSWRSKAYSTDAVLDVVGYLSSRCVAEGIVRSVRNAKTLGGVPSCQEARALLYRCTLDESLSS